MTGSVDHVTGSADQVTGGAAHLKRESGFVSPAEAAATFDLTAAAVALSVLRADLFSLGQNFQVLQMSYFNTVSQGDGRSIFSWQKVF
jgi:hypothetical protein